MKKFFIYACMLSSLTLHSQVGINTTQPKATLDVMPNTVDSSKPDGIIAPRLKGSELKHKDSLYTDDQTGTLVYVTEGLAAGTTTEKNLLVTRAGYYYFDGEQWQPLDDTLETVVGRGNYSPKAITFTGSTQSPTIYGALGMNVNTYSMHFGNMNPNHSGVYNISYGYGALQSLTTAPANTAIGSYSLNGLTTGEYNTFVGYASGYDFDHPQKTITSFSDLC